MRRPIALVLGIALLVTVGPSAAAGRVVDRSTVHLTQIVLAGWNRLQLGYTLGGKAVVLIDKAQYGEYTGATTVDVQVRTADLPAFQVFMRDVTCHGLYREDGTGSANHAYSGVVIDGAHRVSIADAGATCEYRRVDRVPGEYSGNAQVVVTK